MPATILSVQWEFFSDGEMGSKPIEKDENLSIVKEDTLYADIIYVITGLNIFFSTGNNTADYNEVEFLTNKLSTILNHPKIIGNTFLVKGPMGESVSVFSILQLIQLYLSGLKSQSGIMKPQVAVHNTVSEKLRILGRYMNQAKWQNMISYGENIHGNPDLNQAGSIVFGIATLVKNLLDRSKSPAIGFTIRQLNSANDDLDIFIKNLKMKDKSALEELSRTNRQFITELSARGPNAGALILRIHELALDITQIIVDNPHL